MRTVIFKLLFLLAMGSHVTAQETIFLIRHAEKELKEEDPALTQAGRSRAAAWAEMLRPAGLQVVITSDAQRTRQTGGIIAKILELPQNAIAKENIAGLVDTLQFDHENDTVLIVGHTETIPGILANFGVSEDIRIDQSDFANLFILTNAGSDAAKLLNLRMP